MTLGGGVLSWPPVQIAYAVPDVHAAATTWARDHGAGPFFLREHIVLEDVVYRGRPGVFDHSSAYGQWGSMMVELVQDHGVTDTVIRERFGVGHSGLHHVACFVEDLTATMQRLVAGGFQVAMSARTSSGVEFHFIDTVASHGHMFELYEGAEHLRRFYRMVAEAADGWNGADPVRIM